MSLPKTETKTAQARIEEILNSKDPNLRIGGRGPREEVISKTNPYNGRPENLRVFSDGEEIMLGPNFPSRCTEFPRGPIGYGFAVTNSRTGYCLFYIIEADNGSFNTTCPFYKRGRDY
jgi:hypothetical protein